jgi:hypothetical protein
LAQSSATIHFNDKSQKDYFLDEIIKITFPENSIMFQATNESTYPLNSISKITFGTISALPENKSKLHIVVFPNPATDFIYVKGYFTEQFRYSIFNLQGEILRQGMTNTSEAISIATIEKGIYILRVGMYSLKFSKI